MAMVTQQRVKQVGINRKELVQKLVRAAGEGPLNTSVEVH